MMCTGIRSAQDLGPHVCGAVGADVCVVSVFSVLFSFFALFGFFSLFSSVCCWSVAGLVVICLCSNCPLVYWLPGLKRTPKVENSSEGFGEILRSLFSTHRY